MRVSLSGLLINLADKIDSLVDLVNDLDVPAVDDGGFCFAAREVARHCRETLAGKHTIQDFAEFYCLAKPQKTPLSITSEPKPLVITEAEYCPLV